MSEAYSKKQILKSTAIFGSAQIVIIFVGIVRTKVLALLLGPVGVGLSGLYQATVDFVRTATGFGLGYSSVRDIAAAASTGDTTRISTVVLVLKRWAWATGILGLVITILFSKQLSQAAFGNKSHSVEISILSAVLLLSALSSAQSALLQGLRQISNLARATVWSAIASLLSVSVIYYIWGFRGIIPAIIVVAAIEFIVTWIYSTKTKTVPVAVGFSRSFAQGKAMAKIGFFMTLSVLSSTATMYVVRTFIAREGGLHSVGYFVAAWTISSLYISAIFNSMSADYFPRLSEAQHDNEKVKRLVNDQTEISLLLTVPVIIAALSFIDWILPVFYSKEFSETAGVLSWQLAGDFFKTLSWPLGFVLLARARGTVFLIAELIWNILFCCFVYFGWKQLGVAATGVGFLVAYIIYLLVLYRIVSKSISFNWTGTIWNTIFFFFPLLCVSFLVEKFLSDLPKLVCGILFTGLASGYTVNRLRNHVNMKRILTRFGLKKPSQ